MGYKSGTYVGRGDRTRSVRRAVSVFESFRTLRISEITQGLISKTACDDGTIESVRHPSRIPRSSKEYLPSAEIMAQAALDPADAHLKCNRTLLDIPSTLLNSLHQQRALPLRLRVHTPARFIITPSRFDQHILQRAILRRGNTEQ